MWGDPIAPQQSPDVNETNGPTLPAWVGATLMPSQVDPVGTPQMSISEVLADLPVTKTPMKMAIAPGAAPEKVPPVQADSFWDIAHVEDQKAPRAALFDALRGFGIDPWTNDGLDAMQQDPGLAFADEPMEVGAA
jgi:hypothetical protein